MPKAARTHNIAAPSAATVNPYRERAPLRRAVLAQLAAGGGTPPRDPFAGIEDRFGEPVKAGRKTAGFKVVEVAR